MYNVANGSDREGKVREKREKKLDKTLKMKEMKVECEYDKMVADDWSGDWRPGGTKNAAAGVGGGERGWVE